MNRNAILIACLTTLVAVLAAGAVLTGVFPLLNNDDSGRLPCEQLSSQQAVATALELHADRVAYIEGLGDGISVQVATPCDDTDLALLSIRYRTSDERSKVHDYLRDNDGFGVPVELVKQR